MAWFKIDDGMHSHPKTLDAGNEAIGLWARCGSYCSHYLTEGFVKRDVALLYGDMALVDVLVKVGLFEPVEGGWQMHDFLDYNPTKEKVLADREAAAKRQRDARERAKHAREKAAREAAAKNGNADSHGDSHGVTNGVSHADSHIGNDAHGGENGPDCHAVTHTDIETAQEETLAPVLSLVQSDAGHGVAEEMSRCDSRGESRAPRPDPTRPVLLTEVLKEQNPSSSVTATPPPDDTPVIKSKGKSASKPAAEPRADVEALCNRLIEMMAARGCRNATMDAITDRWLDAARLLLDKDGVHPQFAMDVLEWSQKHHFWKTNILSMPKFREKWNALYQQAEAACGPHPNNGRTSEPVEAEVVSFGGNNIIQLPKQRPGSNDIHLAAAMERAQARDAAQSANSASQTSPWKAITG
jgi:hypothetical protein